MPEPAPVPHLARAKLVRTQQNTAGTFVEGSPRGIGATTAESSTTASASGADTTGAKSKVDWSKFDTGEHGARRFVDEEELGTAAIFGLKGDSTLFRPCLDHV